MHVLASAVVASALAVVTPGAGPAPAGTALCDSRQVTITVTAVSGTVHGTPRSDVILVQPTSGTIGDPAPGPSPLAILAGAGNDSVCTSSAQVDVHGGNGDDTIVSTGGPQPAGVPPLLEGGDGADRITGGAATEHLVGGPGADDLFGGPAGDDVLSGGGDSDYLTGSVTEHGSRFTAGHSTLVGGPGDDTLNSHRGVVRGGSGSDGLDVYGTTNAWLGPGHDDALDFAGSSRLPGHTVLRGGSGGDYFEVPGPLPTPTTFKGGPGHDTLRPGMRSGGPYTFDVPTGIASYPGRPRWFRFSGWEIVFGTRRSDIMIGGPENDVFHGSRQADVMRGGGGDDQLYGDNGHDTAYGGPGTDTCLAEVRHGCEAH
ncbi:MAG: calcium-binding protein [Nocardioides sp.]